MPVMRAAENDGRHFRSELNAAPAPLRFHTEVGQAIDVGLLGGDGVGLEVLNDGVWRGPFVRHAQHFRPAQPVHHDVTGALDVVRVEEIRLSQSQRQHRPH